MFFSKNWVQVLSGICGAQNDGLFSCQCVLSLSGIPSTHALPVQAILIDAMRYGVPVNFPLFQLRIANILFAFLHNSRVN